MLENLDFLDGVLPSSELPRLSAYGECLRKKRESLLLGLFDFDLQYLDLFNRILLHF